MKIKLTLVTVLAMSVLGAAGCGGDGDSSGDEEETKAITALVAEINRVTKDRDAQGFCALMQPSGVKKEFNTQTRCVEETAVILERNAGAQPTLEIQEISIDGDKATVDLESNVGGAPVNLVKEGGKWYVPFGGEDSSSSTEPETDTSSE